MGPIRLTSAVNAYLWPRLSELGFHRQSPDSGERWKEGDSLIRTGSQGRPQALLLGRDTFRLAFGINVARQLPDGSWEYMDLSRVGLPRAALSYSTQAELEAVLARIATAMRDGILRWLDEDPPTRALSAERKGTD